MSQVKVKIELAKRLTEVAKEKAGAQMMSSPYLDGYNQYEKLYDITASIEELEKYPDEAEGYIYLELDDWLQISRYSREKNEPNSDSGSEKIRQDNVV